MKATAAVMEKQQKRATTATNNSKRQLVKQPKKAVSSPWTQPNAKFKFGEPMLTEAALESAGPSCVTLHKYYTPACGEKKKSDIVVLFKHCHFLRSLDKECLLVSLADLYDLFNLDAVDTSLLRCFSLAYAKSGVKEGSSCKLNHATKFPASLPYDCVGCNESDRTFRSQGKCHKHLKNT
ncbi:hypothetical protein C2845_PM07G11800 [Panicum miliaceum]|uniref:Uncharacterized protein n=1 Tax=Panicum miliaceum TaxID=4540 RepID=A0A3L6SQL7_PANMI|nr:hypothetical protein C2845_PM07G11800 [Panicum miliaceum]